MAAVSLGTTYRSYFQNQRHIVKSTNGTLLAFSDLTGGALGYKKSTDDGATWDVSWTNVVTGLDSLADFTVYIDSNDDIYVIYNCVYFNARQYFKKLTYSAGSWSLGSAVLINAGSNRQYVTFAKRSNDDFWIAGYNSSGGDIGTFYSSDGGGTWNDGGTISASNIYTSSLIAKGSNIWCIIQRGGGLYAYEYISSWDAGTEIIASGITNSNYGLGVLKISDTNIYVAGRTSSGIKVYNYTGTWDSGTLLSNESDDISASLSSINGYPCLFYNTLNGGSDYDIAYRYNTGSWGDETLIGVTAQSTQHYPNSILSDSENLYYLYVTGSDPYTLYFDKVQLGTKSYSLDSDVKFKVVGDTETINSAVKFINNSNSQIILSSVEFKGDGTETINSDVLFKIEGVEETVNSDVKFVNDSKNIAISSNVNFKIQTSTTINSGVTFSSSYSSKYIYDTKMYIVTDIIGAEIIEVDLTNPATYIKYELSTTGNPINYAKDLVLDTTRDTIYISADDSKVIKTDRTNLTNLTYYTMSSTGIDETQLDKITHSNDYQITYIASEDSRGLLFTLDEATVSYFNTDIRIRYTPDASIMNTIIIVQFDNNIDTDIRVRTLVTSLTNTDIRVTTTDYNNLILNPIARTDFHVYISDVQLGNDDLILNSINITHNDNDASNATFVLTRKCDDINNPTTITNNPNVKIYIKDSLVFEGKIFNLQSDSTNETVSVYCESEYETFDDLTYDFSVKNLSFSTLNTQIHPYDILSANIKIDNPYIDADDANPDYYKGVSIDLGTQITQKRIALSAVASGTTTATNLEEGTFKFQPNYTYFWTISGTKYNLVGVPKTFSGYYIGTGLTSLSTDLYQITSAAYRLQKKIDDVEVDLGTYTLGEAPYKSISTKNGQKIVCDTWVDKEDGMYRETDSYYDYVEYAKAVAAIEYSKLKNINGTILPVSSADIEVTIDAYLYYGIQRLNRINILNTTSSNIYNNSNGFPVAVKQIQISSGTMKVQLSCDNKLSDYEIEKLNNQYPDETDYEYPSSSARIIAKSDLNNI